jgi:hypothetical protein
MQDEEDDEPSALGFGALVWGCLGMVRTLNLRIQSMPIFHLMLLLNLKNERISKDLN